MDNGKKTPDDIEEAFQNAKIWVSMICIPCNHMTEESNELYEVRPIDEGIEKESYSSIDIIKLIRLSRDESSKLQDSLVDIMKYPNKALFRFNDFKGLYDTDNGKNMYATLRERMELILWFVPIINVSQLSEYTVIIYSLYEIKEADKCK